MNIFRTVAWKSLRKNRTRTIVTIIGIILSVAMFTAITTTISTFYNYLAAVEAYESGSYYLGFSAVQHDTLTEMQADSDTKKLTCGEYLGYGLPEGVEVRRGPYLYVLSMSGGFTDMLPVHLTSGRMPENAGELLLPDHLLRYGGIGLKNGDTVDIDLGDRTLDGVQLCQDSAYEGGEIFTPRETRTYTVVGTYERPGFEPGSAPGYTVLTVGEGCGTGLYDTYVTLKSSKTAALEAYQARYAGGVLGGTTTNWGYLRMMGNMRYGNYDRVLTNFCIILFAMIMVGSVSLIYSAFSISVSERTRQFGLLASIGATKKQLRKTVICEAYTVSLIGIPLGLLAGCGGMWVTFALLGDRMGALFGGFIAMKFSVSVPALVIAALVGLLTVRISAMIPARRAMRVSAIEAIRQSRDVRQEKRSLSSGKLAYRLFGLPGMLSKKYFQRSRKKYRATIFSLAMSVLLFISASTYGMYLTSMAGDVALVSSYDLFYAAENLPREEMQTLTEALRGCAGVKKVWSAEQETGIVLSELVDFSPEYREYLEKSHLNTEDTQELYVYPDILRVDAQTYAAICAEAGISPEKGGAILLNRVSRTYFSEDGRYSYEGTILSEKTKTLPVFRNQSVPGYHFYQTYRQDAQGNWLAQYGLYEEDAYWAEHDVSQAPKEQWLPVDLLSIDVAAQLTDSAYATDGFSPQIFLPMDDTEGTVQTAEFFLVADDPEQAKETAAKTLKELLPDYRESDLLDAHEDERNTRDLLTVIHVFSYGFITLISLICVANVFNTISTNVALRRRDFAMLRSVGMTRGGIYRMMSYECLRYGVRALLIGLPLSAGVAVLLAESAREISRGEFRLPWNSVLVAVVCVFLVVFVSMLYAVGKIRGDNPVEALKDENV